MLKILIIIGGLVLLAGIFVVAYGHRYTKWASQQSLDGTWLFTGKDFSVTYQFVHEKDNTGLFYRLHEDANNKFRVFGSWMMPNVDEVHLIPLASELPERFTIGIEHPARLHFFVNKANEIRIYEGEQPFNFNKVEKDIRSEFESPVEEK